MSKPLRVLLVEDSEGDALLLLRELRQGGYDPTFTRVETAAALTTAMEAPAWDIVISDFRLPQLDGLQVLKLVQARGADVPFILVSGAIGEDTAVAAMKAGAHDYVLKGNLARLVPAVQRALLDAETRRQRRRAQEQLRLQSKVLQSAANAIVITGCDGLIQWVNEAFTRLTGYSSAEAIGQNPRVLKSGRHPETFYRKMWETVLAGHVWHGELVNKRKDASLYTEEMTITPVTDHGGAISHFIAIKQDVTERKQAEEAIRRLNEELEQRVADRTAELETANADLRNEIQKRSRLEQEILEISEREQRRLGQDLHDDLGQQLTGITLMAGLLESNLRKELHAQASGATELVEFLREAIASTRKLARGLYPIELDHGGLIVALENLASKTEVAGISCVVSHDPAFQCDKTAKIHVYRIVQEAVNNAIKHAKAKSIAIECSSNAHGLTLSITNDGAPFQEPRPGSSGLGLELMRYRARMIGGKIDIRKRNGGGCKVSCSLPRAKAAD